jgi:hypothetical protein
MSGGESVFWIEKVGFSADLEAGATVYLIASSFNETAVKALERAAAEPLDYEARWGLAEDEEGGACFVLAVGLGRYPIIRSAIRVPSDEETRRVLVGSLAKARTVVLCHGQVRVGIDNPPSQLLWLALEPDLEQVVSALDALPVPDLSPMVARMEETEIERLREFDERVTELMERPLLTRNHGLGVREDGTTDLLSDAEERKALLLDARPLFAQREPGSFRVVLNILRRRAHESEMADAANFFGLLGELEGVVRKTPIIGGSAEDVLSDVLNGFVFHADADRRERVLEHHSKESALFHALSVVRRLGIAYVLTQRLAVRPCLAIVDGGEQGQGSQPPG